ncbi:hypothetical protein D3C77_343710 [compost metagenome]
MHFLALILDCLEMLLRMQGYPIKIVIVEGQAAQRRVGGLGQAFEALGIEACQQRAAIVTDARPPLFIVQHAPVLTPHRQYQYLQVAALDGRGDGRELLGIGAIGDQHQSPGQLFGSQQGPGLLDYTQHILAGTIHQPGGQRLQKAVQQTWVLGSWKYQMGAAGIGNQRRTGPSAAAQQVVHLVFGGRQARGWHIVGIHRR